MSQMFLNVVSTFKGDGLAAATRQLGAFGSAAGGLGSTLGKVGAALASFGIAAKAVQFTQKTIDEAKNLQQNLFALDLIFGKLSPEMENFAKGAAKIGLSQAEAAKASVFLGSVMKQSGFGIEDVAKKTQTLVSLASDLALVYQYDVQEALLGMTALFRGEYDPIEKFGVAMKQSEINAVLVAKKLNHLTGEQRRLAEQTIRYDLFLQRATDSVGAFGRSSGNLAAESLKLSAEFKNMQSTVGAALVPTITDLVIALKPLVEQLTPRLIQLLGDAKPAIEIFNNFLKDLGDETTTTSQVVGHFADSLGTIFRLIAENFGTILTLTALIGGLRIAFVLLTAVMNATPIGFVLTGLGLLAGAFVLVNDAAKKADDSLYKYNVELLKTDPVKQAIAPYMVYEGILGKTSSAFSRAAAEANGYKAELNSIPKDISTTVNLKFAMPRGPQGSKTETSWGAIVDSFLPKAVVSTDLGVTDTGGGKTSGSKTETIADVLQREGRLLQRETKLLGFNLSQGFVDTILSTATTSKAIKKVYAQLTSSTDAAAKMQEKFNNTRAGQAELEAARVKAESARIEQQRENDRIAQELADAEKARVEEQQRVYNSFLDAVKNTFGGIKNAILGAFDLTGLGGSTNSILRNMEKMLTKLRSFSASVRQLATMGLDPALLQQIISMGPMAGARLASTLVAGGANALSAINAGYGQFGSLASEIARTGTESSFRTEAQQNQFTINVNGGVGSGATIGKAIVEAIADYERTSGAVWQRA
jgi:hypothetical protein